MLLRFWVPSAQFPEISIKIKLSKI